MNVDYAVADSVCVCNIAQFLPPTQSVVTLETW